MKRKRKQITLTLTQACNLRCKYCFEKNKSAQRMTFPLIQSILDKELNDEYFEEYEIDFFGGEPFLEFDLIKQTVDYVLRTYPNKLLIFSATTNGTLVHGEIKEWLQKRKEIFWCALSCDGPKHVHDMNRCNSFDDIDIDFFHDTWPMQDMKMTISPQTLPYLSESIIFMHEKGYNFTVNLAYDIDWSDKDNKAIIERELMKLVEYYLAHPDVKRCSLFDIPIYKVSYSDANGFRQCGAGVEMISYDADGKGYPCQFFMPISVGEERSNQASGLTFNELITEDNFEEPCKSCKALRICRTCYGANYATNGNIFKKDSNWCILQKVIFKANAYLAAKQIENNTLSCQAGELPYLLKSVQTLLTDFD